MSFLNEAVFFISSPGDSDIYRSVMCILFQVYAKCNHALFVYDTPPFYLLMYLFCSIFFLLIIAESYLIWLLEAINYHIPLLNGIVMTNNGEMVTLSIHAEHFLVKELHVNSYSFKNIPLYCD